MVLRLPIPPRYSSSPVLTTARAASRSPSIATWTVGEISSSERWRPPLASPASTCSPQVASKASGEEKIGIQPSAISAASSTDLRPIAPRKTGIRLRTGWKLSFSALPSPSGSGSSKCSPWYSNRSSRATTLRTISTYSLVRPQGFGYRTPYQPSETWGPDGPKPKMNRPPDSASIVHPAIAAAAGARAGTCMIAAPSWIVSVWGASQASTLTTSDPYDSAAQAESNPARSAARTASTASSPRGPIPQ